MIDYPVRVPDPNIRNKFKELIDAVNTATGQLSASEGAHTIVLAKLTTNGTNGSITWNANGLVLSWVDPT